MLDREFQYFQGHLEEIKRKHPKRFVVIRGEEVIGEFDSLPDAFHLTSKKFPLGTFLVQDTSEEGLRPRQFHSRVYV